MITVIKYILLELLVVIYQFTSFEIWGLDLGSMAQTARDYVTQSTVIHILQIILAPITILLFFGLLKVSRQQREFREKIRAQQEAAQTPAPVETVLANRWQEIMQHIESIREGEWKFAVIEADKLVDDQLKNLFPGETMGERLMNIDKTSLLSIDGLWEAHKVRNRLAHESNYFLRHAEAVRAIRLYEQTLKELGVL